jgi:hypothetical protein
LGITEKCASRSTLHKVSIKLYGLALRVSNKYPKLSCEDASISLASIITNMDAQQGDIYYGATTGWVPIALAMLHDMHVDHRAPLIP